MSHNELYDLVFKAELIRGIDEAVARKNIGMLFKIPEQKVAVLFSGQPVVLKRGLDFDTANKFRVAIKKAGCRVDLREQNVKASANATSTPKAPAPVSPVAHQASTSATLKTNEAPISHDSGLVVAPAGTPVLRESERAKIEAIDIDVSGISVRGLDGDLLDDEEKSDVAAANIDTKGLSLASASGNLVNEEERETEKAVDVDVSGLSLAAVGEKLGEVNEKKPVLNPKTSHLTIVK